VKKFPSIACLQAQPEQKYNKQNNYIKCKLQTFCTFKPLKEKGKTLAQMKYCYNQVKI
jgi:hypothetical protein